MSIGADHAGHGIADGHAVAHLGDGRHIVVADHGERTAPILRLLRPKVDDLRRRLPRLVSVQLRACRVTEGAPRRHAALAARLRHAAVGIDAGREGKLAGADLERIGTAGHHCLLRPGFNTADAASPCRRRSCPARRSAELARAGSKGSRNRFCCEPRQVGRRAGPPRLQEFSWPQGNRVKHGSSTRALRWTPFL